MKIHLKPLFIMGVFLACPFLEAQLNFDDLNVQSILALAKDYRHRADVLRRLIGVRERKISFMQEEANGLILQAQNDAQAQAQAAAQAQGQAKSDNAVLGGAASFIGNFIPGGNSFAGQMVQGGLQGLGSAEQSQASAQVQNAQVQGQLENDQAQKNADSLMEQAKNFQGEKKKLAYKAKQYEQLADAEELLAASEILRVQANKEAQSAADMDNKISSQRQFVENLDIW
ncbi:MAG: hypothetical protein ACYCPQ_07930 [Elusimicrobiota bacterium]